MNINHDNTMVIYEWFQKSMRKVGRKISFPKNTDPRKTYQYRAMRDFLRKIHEWDLDESSAKAIIDSAVRYGKKHQLLDKGAMILNMSGVIDICIDDLESKESDMNVTIAAIRRCKEYLDNEGLNSYNALIAPRTLGGYSNLYYLIKSGKISPVYMALSRKVYRALSSIDRSDCPSNYILLRLRAKLLFDPEARKKLESILGDDLNTIGLGAANASR